MDPFYVSWKAPEYAHHPKSLNWYWISIIVAILMLGISVWQRNYMFAVFIVIAEILLIMWGDRHPEMIEFVLTEKGLKIGEDKFYPLNDLRSFSVETEDHIEVDWIDINIFFKSKVKPSLVIKASKEEVYSISAAFSMVITKEEWQPTFMDIIERVLKL